jgi:HEAT repeats
MESEKPGPVYRRMHFIASSIFWKIQYFSDFVTANLIRNLRDKDGVGREEARHALAFIGKPAVPYLIPLLNESDADVRWEAAKTLAKIGDSSAAPDLVVAMDDANFGIRWLAAEGSITRGKDALPPLLQALIERPESVLLRKGAHHVLYELSKKGYKEVCGQLPLRQPHSSSHPLCRGCLTSAFWEKSLRMFGTRIFRSAADIQENPLKNT